MSRKNNKKSLSYKRQQIQQLEEGLINNGIAMTEHKKKKSWSLNDFRTITPLNEPQREAFEEFTSGQHLILNGSAGTGKTYAALYLAITDVLSSHTETKRIIIVRSAVASRNVGHLPGSLEEKTEVYEMPYKDMVSNLHCTGNPNTYDYMKESGLIQFMPTSFVRGLTWDDAIIIVDEVQNLNFHELNSIITRVGDESSLIMVGDYIQTDLNKSSVDVSGMNRFLEIARTMPEFSEVVFGPDDIIRSGLVKSWILALEQAS